MINFATHVFEKTYLPDYSLGKLGLSGEIHPFNACLDLVLHAGRFLVVFQRVQSYAYIWRF